MSQGKFVKVGFRAYQNISIDVTNTATPANAPKGFDKLPEGNAEYVELRNTGNADCSVWFNKYTNDRFTIKAGATKELPLKVHKIFAVCGTTTTLEVTGYAE